VPRWAKVGRCAGPGVVIFSTWWPSMVIVSRVRVARVVEQVAEAAGGLVDGGGLPGGLALGGGPTGWPGGGRRYQRTSGVGKTTLAVHWAHQPVGRWLVNPSAGGSAQPTPSWPRQAARP
jgi:hypothetical protein